MTEFLGIWVGLLLNPHVRSMFIFPCSRWDYVAWETKVTILKELGNKNCVSEDEAQVVVDSPVFHYIWEMLGSLDSAARISSCWLLFNMTQYKFTIPPILEMGGCGRLVALLRWVWYVSFQHRFSFNVI
jgi:hypothetical protein